MTPLELATLFHNIYERRAPEFGYETRPETRQFDPTTPNGRLMMAVCDEVLRTLGAVINRAEANVIVQMYRRLKCIDEVFSDERAVAVRLIRECEVRP